MSSDVLRAARRIAKSSSLLVLLPAFGVAAQSVTTVSAFTPGSREIFALDLASVPAGSLPKGLRLLRGKATVVTKFDGPALKASEPTEVLISLPELLPDGFTIEFEIVPKACCNPEDLSFEGTPTISRSEASMQVEWHPETVIAAGGGALVQRPMPGEIKEVVPSQPTMVQASFQGKTFKLFTNGHPVLELPNRSFARGRVLRVFLGGQDNDQYAVYLKKLRIAAITSTVATTTSGAALNADLASGATGTISEVSTLPTINKATSPTTTSVAVPTSPGVTAGPLPAGTTATSSSVTTATQTTLSAVVSSIPVVVQDSTTSQQNAVGSGRPGIPTVTAPIATAPLSTSTSVIPGPTRLSGSQVPLGWGAMLQWPVVANASSYWVFRKATSSTVAGATTPVVFVPALQSATNATAIDPFVDPALTYTYWVQAFIPGSGFTGPSPIVMVDAPRPPLPPDLLRASVSGSAMLTMPGVLATKGPMPGSAVTWTWDPVKAYIYQISYEIVGGMPGVGPVFERMVIATTGADPKPAPVTLGVPQGTTVKFCVHVYASPDRTQPLPSDAVCRNTTVP